MGAIAKRTSSGIGTALLAAAGRVASPRTREAYREDVQTFLDYCDGKGYSPFEALGKWRESMLKGGARSALVNRRLSAVRSSIRRAAASLPGAQRGAVLAALTEVKGVKTVKAAIPSERMLTVEEFRKVLAVLSPRGRGFARFLYATGCRISEALGVRLTDCKTNGRVSIEVMGKGQKVRAVTISRELYDELRETFAGETYLFETSSGRSYRREYVTDMIRRASKRAIGRVVSAHGLRHSFATDTIRRTGKIEAVSRYLGHADASTTLRYYVHETLTPEELAGSEVKA